MKPMPEDPKSSESIQGAPFDARFYGKMNVVIGLLIGVLVAILLVTSIIVYMQIGIGKRIDTLEDQVGVSQEQAEKFANLGDWVDDVDARLGKVDDQLQNIDSQLVLLKDQDAKNIDILNSTKDIANTNADAITKNTEALNDLDGKLSEPSD